jgi:hypothetical protein
MQRFPIERKAALVDQLAVQKPDAHRRLPAKKDLEQALVKLRQEGFVLIDFQVKGAATTSVWYRKADPLLVTGRQRPEVTKLVQEEAAGGNIFSWWL